MPARVILAVLAAVFLGAGLWRLWRDGTPGPAARTWLLVGAVFSAVGVWLWSV